jgi:hypothetical protein
MVSGLAVQGEVNGEGGGGLKRVAIMDREVSWSKTSSLIWRKQWWARTLEQRVCINHIDHLFTLSGTQASAPLSSLFSAGLFKRPAGSRRVCKHQGDRNLITRKERAISPQISCRLFAAVCF